MRDRVCLRIERETCFMTYTADPSHFLIQLLPSNDNPRYCQLILTPFLFSHLDSNHFIRFKKRRRNSVHGSASSTMRESTATSRPPAGRGEEVRVAGYLILHVKIPII